MRKKWTELIINDLSYNTLIKVIEGRVLYDSNRIIVKQKKFTPEEIEKALCEQTSYLAKVYSLNEDDCIEETECLNNRGAVIDLLTDMLGDDYENNTLATAIQEKLLFKQMQLYGLRKFIFCSNKNKNSRYFNVNARIDTEFID